MSRDFVPLVLTRKERAEESLRQCEARVIVAQERFGRTGRCAKEDIPWLCAMVLGLIKQRRELEAALDSLTVIKR